MTIIVFRRKYGNTTKINLLFTLISLSSLSVSIDVTILQHLENCRLSTIKIHPLSMFHNSLIYIYRTSDETWSIIKVYWQSKIDSNPLCPIKSHYALIYYAFFFYAMLDLIFVDFLSDIQTNQYKPWKWHETKGQGQSRYHKERWWKTEERYS